MRQPNLAQKSLRLPFGLEAPCVIVLAFFLHQQVFLEKDMVLMLMANLCSDASY